MEQRAAKVLSMSSNPSLVHEAYSPAVLYEMSRRRATRHMDNTATGLWWKVFFDQVSHGTSLAAWPRVWGSMDMLNFECMDGQVHVSNGVS